MAHCLSLDFWLANVFIISLKSISFTSFASIDYKIKCFNCISLINIIFNYLHCTVIEIIGLLKKLIAHAQYSKQLLSSVGRFAAKMNLLSYRFKHYTDRKICREKYKIIRYSDVLFSCGLFMDYFMLHPQIK